ncbi:MAG: fibronectin-binding domain-containing protein [Nanoarchaeota archaeon]|nr:fibronectin-binding domain-containing protein [Nanoarchaeota archaeon]
MEHVKNITSLDLYCVVRELQNIREAKVEKVYQPGNDELVFVLYHKNYGKLILRILSGRAIYLSNYKKDYKHFPPHFCMFLRKHLTNSFIKSIAQKNNDRILEINFDTKDGIKKLVCELFSPGNFVLCNSDNDILALKQVQVFRDRKIMVHKPYILPEKRMTPLTLNLIMFKRTMNYSRMGSVVKSLAADIGLGGKYAEEICLRARIDKDKPLSDLKGEDYEKLYSQIDAFVRILKYKKYEPSIILENEKPTDYQPTPLECYANSKKTETDFFNRAVDEYYTKNLFEIETQEKEEIKEKQVNKFEIIKEKQEERIKELETKSEEKREHGADIMQKIGLLEQVRLAILKTRNAGESWDEIREKLEIDRKNGIEAALLVENLDPATRTFKVKGVQSRLNFDSTIGSQASKMYETAKQSESKIGRAKEHLEITEQKISEAEQIIPEQAQELKEITQKTYANWYEKFKYFHTTNNNLLVCGRDAVQNDILIKRYVRNEDIIFHADLPGSPFGILRKETGNLEQNDYEEAGTFIACHSRAWRDGFGAADVYWVTPQQLSKESGLQKGSFMVYGRRNYLHGKELTLAIGRVDNKIISGPENTVKNKTMNYNLIKPGELTQTETAKQLSEKLGITDIDEIVRHLPAGNSKIIWKTQHSYKIEKKEEKMENRIEQPINFENDFSKIETEKTSFEEEIPSEYNSFLDEEIEEKPEKQEEENQKTEKTSEELDDFDYDDFSF